MGRSDRYDGLFGLIRVWARGCDCWGEEGIRVSVLFVYEERGGHVIVRFGVSVVIVFAVAPVANASSALRGVGAAGVCISLYFVLDGLFSARLKLSSDIFHPGKHLSTGAPSCPWRLPVAILGLGLGFCAVVAPDLARAALAAYNKRVIFGAELCTVLEVALSMAGNKAMEHHASGRIG